MSTLERRILLARSTSSCDRTVFLSLTLRYCAKDSLIVLLSSPSSRLKPGGGANEEWELGEMSHSVRFLLST